MRDASGQRRAARRRERLVGPLELLDGRHDHADALNRRAASRLTIVEIAEQLGYSPAMTLRSYAHVIDELRGAGRVDPDELIADARGRQARRRDH